MMRFDPNDTMDFNSRNIREQRFLARTGPCVGDWVVMPNGEERRFTHAWDGEIQTTTCGNAYGSSFYMGKDGYASFSGGLDPSIPYDKLTNTGKTKPAMFWFFHHELAGAHRGVAVEIEARVWEYRDETWVCSNKTLRERGHKEYQCVMEKEGAR
jgi:hypothetical protein